MHGARIQDNTSTITNGHDIFECYHPLTLEGHDQFINELRRLWADLPSTSPGTSPKIPIDEALELLCPANIPRLITNYFEQWHQHSPVIHPGLFDPNETFSPLLLAVVLVGALYSSDERMVQSARGLITLAEHWVFGSQVFSELSSISKGGVKTSQFSEFATKFQAIQAAFVMSKILLREGDEDKTEYVRSVLFDRIIIVTHPPRASRALSNSQLSYRLHDNCR
jgi:Fungal specific transcription factor domain